MEIKRANKIVFITSSVLIAIHLMPSFGAQAILGSPFLTLGYYGLSISIIFKIASFFIEKNNFSRQSESRVSKVTFSIIVLMASIALFQDFKLRYGDAGEVYRSYSEKNGNLFYNSPYRFHNLWKTRYNYYPSTPYGKKKDKKLEFQYEYSYNNLGFRNDGKDVLGKKPNEYRILAIGDSWTEGIGTPDGQTWTAYLQNKFSNSAKNINVINVGNSGSDPVYELHTLKALYGDLKPDEVILTINISDINDIIGRGGQERYNKKNAVSLKTGPWWEFLYAGSFLVRKYIRDDAGYSRLLIKHNKMMDCFQDANKAIQKTIIEFQFFCQENNIKLSVVFVPAYWDMVGITRGKLGIEWGIMVNIYNVLRENGIQSIYLPDCYLEKITDDPKSYWWQYDYHHTPKGYIMMADCIFQEISQ